MGEEYYHVHVYWFNSVNGYNNGDWELDLTRENVAEWITEPYLQGQRFHINGNAVLTTSVTGIKIYCTSVPSAKLDADSFNGNIGDAIKAQAEDVSRDFIKGAKTTGTTKTAFNLEEVFIVHGHDKVAEIELARLIENDLDLTAVILHEQASGGRTLIEKLERHSSTPGYAFVLLTPDDIGGKREPTGRVPDLKHRARQNVILELGYFIGKLGRDRVCCLYTGDMEIPTDIVGVLYLKFEKSVRECLGEIVKELKTAGYSVSL